ncbi:hypothetical protein AMJ52_00070 [candidate division TA06 bacterium DG_78]|uniref:Uncharacterized protein n=1 Tax=candidate division TA06 bacterium DG_78 TaxID=1703772 RepID=A0A0S7YIJ1_UNCT6|nr:MAG: hypothetical protein AMJ52_00070 [candidate division TA06 bacterium DG_78]
MNKLNTKSEILNPKQIRSPKYPKTKLSNFEFCVLKIGACLCLTASVPFRLETQHRERHEAEFSASNLGF